MKKLIIIVIGAFTLLFGVNVEASTLYTLDTPIAELNNHSLREVFLENNNEITEVGSQWVNNLDGSYYFKGPEASFASNIAVTDLNTFQTDYYINFKINSRAYIAIYDNEQIIYYAAYEPEILTFKVSTDDGIIRIYAGKLYAFTLYDWYLIDLTALGIDNLTIQQMDYWFNVYQDLLKDIDRVSQLPNQFIDIFGEFVNNFVIGFRGFTELIYIDGYGLTDLGIILLIVSSISVIGFGFYIIRKVIK